MQGACREEIRCDRELESKRLTVAESDMTVAPIHLDFEFEFDALPSASQAIREPNSARRRLASVHAGETVANSEVRRGSSNPNRPQRRLASQSRGGAAMHRIIRLVLWMGCSATTFAQSTWYVDASAAPGGDGSAAAPFQTIGAAVQHPAVDTGDTVQIAPGLYVENIVLGDKGLRLRGAGARSTEVRAATHGAVFESPSIGPLVTLSRMTLTGSPAYSTVGVSGGNVVVRNCVLKGHVGGGPPPNQVGAGAFSSDDLQLDRCTVYDNEYGLTLFGHASASAENSILYGNRSFDVAPLLGSWPDALRFCLWGSGASPLSTGPGNLHVDPLWWDAASGDVALRPDSPCIDAGDPTAPLDPDGSRSDIGALRFDPLYAPGPAAYCTA